MNNLIVYILLFGTCFAFSQVNYKGKVINKNNQPIEFADVVLFNNEQIIKGTVTNDKGEFLIDNVKGDYVLKVSFLGYKDWEKNIVLKNDMNIELIELIENNEQLEEVEIEALNKTFKRTADRLVFDVKNSLIAKSNGDATELLNFTPSVIVEDESIQVLGKKGTQVLINGRDSKLEGPALMAYLKSMKASDIDNIEIINTPPAKYDAEGNIALINIITQKKDVDFWNANISSSYRQGYYGLFSNTGSFNYNKNNLFFSANLTYTNGERKGEERNEIFYPDNLWNQQTDYIYKTDLLTTNISSEYRINSNWLLGAQYVGSFSTPSSSNKSNILIEQPSNISSQINNIGEEEGKKTLHNYNFHTVVNITSERIINVDFDYFNYEREQESIVESNPISGGNLSEITNITNSSLQSVTNFASKVDVVYPIGNSVLNFGSKVSFSETDNNVLITGGVDFDQQTEFTYDEDIQALYTSYNSSFGLSEWSFKTGLRLERTQTSAIEKTLNSEVKNEYLDLFPTLYINYKLNQYSNFSLDYSKRINRPSFSSLNPFRIYTSPFSFSEGNPSLLPVYSSTIMLSHLYKSVLNTIVYYSKSDDNSGQVAVLDDDDLTQSITRLNYFDSYNIGLYGNYMYDKKKWWQSSNTVQVYYVESISSIYPITPREISGVGGLLKTSNHFVVDKKQKLLTGFDFTYRFPSPSGDLVFNFEQYLLNSFIKYKASNKLQVSLTANNILREFNFNNKSTRNQIEAIYSGYYDTQYLKFSINYNFGNKNIKQTNRQMSNTEEKNRT